MTCIVWKPSVAFPADRGRVFAGDGDGEGDSEGEGEDFLNDRKPLPLKKGSRKPSVTRLKTAPASLRFRIVLPSIDLATRPRRQAGDVL